MADFAAKQQATKRVDKVIYTRQTRINQSDVNRALKRDHVISEQPLQINLHWHVANSPHNDIESKVFAITMRSVGHDKFLILGLLFSEGIIKSFADIDNIYLDTSADSTINNTNEKTAQETQQTKENNWHVQLVVGKQPKLTSIERFQTTYSSCGLCGATSLKALELKDPPNLLSVAEKSQFNSNFIYTLADKMRTQQQLFTLTGGVHGAALFNQQAQLLSVFEDIGRHNAVDKLIGHWLTERKASQTEQLLVMLVSGRVSFEIVQKAVMAGISILVAVGSPSDLAIKAAQRFELTLIGFASYDSFNLYHGDWRITQN